MTRGVTYYCPVCKSRLWRIPGLYPWRYWTWLRYCRPCNRKWQVEEKKR